MHKIVLASSAMWLFDMIKNVTSSTVPGKKWSQSGAILFVCVHTDKTGRQSHENPCLFDRCMEPAVFCTAPFAEGLGDSELQKSALKMVTIRVVRFWSGMRKLLFVKKLMEEDPHITVPEICEICDLSIGTAEGIVRDDLNPRKIVVRWVYTLIKETLANGRKCSRIQGLAKAVNSELHAFSPSDYRNAFESWRRQPQLCVRSRGEYFEGM